MNIAVIALVGNDEDFLGYAATLEAASDLIKESSYAKLGYGCRGFELRYGEGDFYRMVKDTRSWSEKLDSTANQSFIKRIMTYLVQLIDW